MKSLEEKGLIYRKPNPEDGRGVLIFLTEAGKEKRDLSKKSVIEFNEAIKKNVSAEKLEHFIEVTEKINELIQVKNIFKPTETK